jgi:hypothetical protein
VSVGSEESPYSIDDDPSNSLGENLAVLCFDCHRETQIRGGFDRKLDAAQVKVYRTDWVSRIEAKRNEAAGPALAESVDENRVLRYLQVREKSDECSYDLEADYALVGSQDSTTHSETNLCIKALVTRHLQRFRVDAITRAAEKNEMKKTSFAATAWDSLAMSHSVSLFTTEALSLEFQLASYYAGAAHPNTQTRTQNFRLYPSMELELQDMFKASSKYLDVLSRYCVNDLHRQQPPRWHDPAERTEQLKNHQDEWILSGAGPNYRNYERFSLRKNGMVIHFDPYQVGSHAEGNYEVFVPAWELKS